MALYRITNTTLTNIADSIRNTINESDTYTPYEMADIINSRMVGIPDPIVAGDYPIAGMTTDAKINSSEYTDLDVYHWTVNRAGTYRVKYAMMKPAIGGTPTSAVFLNDTVLYENSSFSNNMQYNSVDVTANVGDIIYVKGKYSGSMYSGYIFGVHICIDWSNPNAFFV